MLFFYLVAIDLPHPTAVLVFYLVAIDLPHPTAVLFFYLVAIDLPHPTAVLVFYLVAIDLPNQQRPRRGRPFPLAKSTTPAPRASIPPRHLWRGGGQQAGGVHFEFIHEYVLCGAKPIMHYEL